VPEGQLEEDGVQARRPQTDRPGHLEQPRRVDRLVVHVVGEHVREADDRRVTSRLVAVMALDERRKPAREAPAPREHAAHERVVDAEAPQLGTPRASGVRASPCTCAG
jgi:hypothetical protein